MEVGNSGVHVQKLVVRDDKSVNDKISTKFHMKYFLATGKKHYKHDHVKAKIARKKNAVF